MIAKQALKVQHVSNIIHTWEPLELAKLMVENSKNFTKVFFCNSGTEANEAALKFARKISLAKAMKMAAGIPADSAAKAPAYTAFGCKAATPTACFTQGGTCGCWPQANNNDVAMGVKNEVIAFKNSFHGRTMGALAATHKPQIRMPFAPFPADVRFARFNVLDGELMTRLVERFQSLHTMHLMLQRLLPVDTPPMHAPAHPVCAAQTCTSTGTPRSAPSSWSRSRARAASTPPTLAS